MASFVFPLNSLDSKPTCSANCSISVNGSLQIPLSTLWIVVNLWFRHVPWKFALHRNTEQNASVDTIFHETIAMSWCFDDICFPLRASTPTSHPGRVAKMLPGSKQAHKIKQSFILSCTIMDWSIAIARMTYTYRKIHTHMSFSIMWSFPSHTVRTKGMLVNVRTERVNGPVLLSRAVILEEQKNDMRPKLDSRPSLPKQQMQAPPLPNPSQPYHILALASHGASSPQSAGSPQRYWHRLACRGQRLDLLTVSSAKKRRKRKSLLFITEEQKFDQLI